MCHYVNVQIYPRTLILEKFQRGGGADARYGTPILESAPESYAQLQVVFFVVFVVGPFTVDRLNEHKQIGDFAGSVFIYTPMNNNICDYLKTNYQTISMLYDVVLDTLPFMPITQSFLQNINLTTKRKTSALQVYAIWKSHLVFGQTSAGLSLMDVYHFFSNA